MVAGRIMDNLVLRSHVKSIEQSAVGRGAARRVCSPREKRALGKLIHRGTPSRLDVAFPPAILVRRICMHHACTRVLS